MSDRIIPFPFEELQRRRAERAGKLSEHPQTASALLPSQAEEKNPDTDAADAAFSRPGGLLPHGPIFRPLASEGQSPSWNMRLGSGLGMTCSRNPLFPDPEEEAARIIGRAIRYGRKCARYQIPIPHGTLNALARFRSSLSASRGQDCASWRSSRNGGVQVERRPRQMSFISARRPRRLPVRLGREQASEAAGRAMVRTS